MSDLQVFRARPNGLSLDRKLATLAYSRCKEAGYCLHRHGQSRLEPVQGSRQESQSMHTLLGIQGCHNLTCNQVISMQFQN